jgi:cytochrome P450
MVLYPDVQRRAQEEIDSIIGRERLPEPGDKESLPYIEAVCREVLRWHVLGPLGLQHVPMADDWYKGYYIPAGE